MATSKCAHCRNDKFELSSKSLTGADHKIIFVQCAGCGVTVGIMDAPPGLLAGVEATLQKHGATLREIRSRLDSVQTMVRQISRESR